MLKNQKLWLGKCSIISFSKEILHRFKMELVSVIIPTYNRFYFLMNCLKSIKNQTYENIEIIIVNDCSTQKEYYEYNFDPNIKVIHLEKNTKNIFGFGCAGYVRNIGLKNANGVWVAFCDDDDIWFPDKIKNQILKMNQTKLEMCCSEGLIGNGVYDSNKIYKRYNKEANYDAIKSIFQRKNKFDLIKNGYPSIWNLDFISVHNCIVTSSLIVKRELLEKVGGMINIRYGEDYDCWLKILKFTDCLYLDEVYFYYDLNHGEGSLY